MKITIVDKETQNAKYKDVKFKNGMVYINVSDSEAMLLIRSFINQIMAKNPNTGRLETFAENGVYVSIGVNIPEREMSRTIKEFVDKYLDKYEKEHFMAMPAEQRCAYLATALLMGDFYKKKKLKK